MSGACRMHKLFLIKYGEIALKGRNREMFENKLLSGIYRQVGKLGVRVHRGSGRYYVYADGADTESVSRQLETVFGIVSFSPAFRCEKNIQTIDTLSVQLSGLFLENGKGNQFKIEARRTDKSFPLNSYEIACRLGELIRTQYPELKVNVKNPDWILNVEIREHAFLYGPVTKGPGGLPLGVAGKGMLMLSGGIDSPASGYLMGKRGLELEAVYFHTHPFTSPQAREKVETITEILTQYFPRIRLHVVPFTETQIRIKERAYPSHITLLMRACMVSITQQIARRYQAVCLVTGESLGQVASQTPESLRFTGSFSDLPVFRPLIGMDKEEIIQLAKKIGTYNTSILPYPDCCSIFSPHNPVIKPRFETMMHAFNALDIKSFLADAVEHTQVVDFESK